MGSWFSRVKWGDIPVSFIWFTLKLINFNYSHLFFWTEMFKIFGVYKFTYLVLNTLRGEYIDVVFIGRNAQKLLKIDITRRLTKHWIYDGITWMEVSKVMYEVSNWCKNFQKKGETCILTHWGWDKMTAIWQMTFSNAFSWMKMF